MLSESLKQSMDEMLMRVSECRCGQNINVNIKWLARNLSIAEMFRIPDMKKMLMDDELEYVENVITSVRKIVDPAFNKLSRKALKHFQAWYKRISPDADLYKYQYYMACWGIEAIILRKDVTVPYTMLVSRGE